jgi:hypothetical protein
MPPAKITITKIHVLAPHVDEGCFGWRGVVCGSRFLVKITCRSNVAECVKLAMNSYMQVPLS